MNGLKQTFTGPDSIMYEYTYGNINELKAIQIPGVGSITLPAYQWTRPKTMVFPGGSTRSFEYDPLMRLKRLLAKDPGGNALLDYEYMYDPVGNITVKGTEHGSYGYGYDPASRLTSAEHPVLADEAYTYDNVGNRQTAAGIAGSWSYNMNNELLGFADMTYTYDANGNMTQKRIGSVGVNYVYNAENRLVKVEDDLTKTVIAEYYYDPFGRRLWKDVGGTRTYFCYSDEGLIAEYDATGAEIRSYGYQPDSTWMTDPLWLKQDGQYYWYQNDHLGTPQKLVAQHGAVVWSARYEAFGQAHVEVDAVVNHLRFPGQYFDAETGLHYNWFRYYAPGIGRFLRIDPIGLNGEINLYGFVQNNPLNKIDPHGLTTKEDIGNGKLDYSCRCGWIDWTHATPAAVAGLWDPVVGVQSNRGLRGSKTGKGFLVRYGQKMYPGDWKWLTIAWEGSYFVQYNLSPSDQESVALGIFKEMSESFEGTFQGWLAPSSSFSAEDLPSDLIAFYRAVKGYSKDEISDMCGVVPKCVAEKVWERTIGSGKMGKNDQWTPKNYNHATCPTSCSCPSPPIHDGPSFGPSLLPLPWWAANDCFCPSTMDWPKELDVIKARPKGSLWRDWNDDADVLWGIPPENWPPTPVPVGPPIIDRDWDFPPRMM